MSKTPEKPMPDSRQYLAEIVGEEALRGSRMQAGGILDLMDLLAGRVASRHCGGAVVTLSFDRVELTQPILHEDLVRLEGSLAHVGNSSMMVAVEVFRQDQLSRLFLPVQHSFVTMVAIDGKGRPVKDIAGLKVETKDEQAVHQQALEQKSLAAAWQEMQKEVVAQHHFSVAAVEEPFNREKQEFLSMEQTAVRVRRVFMPRHANVLGTVFGGDILLWMDRVATHTARRFTRNQHMVTLAMNRLFFKEPIYASDLVEMVARVVYVRNVTLEVELEVVLERPNGQRIPSHSGYFTILNFDEAGFKRPIITGLKLSDEDQEGLGRYEQARRRHQFWRRHRNLNSVR